MLIEWLTLFIIVTFVALLISAYMMEYYPYFSIPFILLGMIFSILCTYGFWNVEWAVLRSDNVFFMESVSYGEPYSYVFMFVFFIFFLFFIRAGWNAWKESLATKSEFTYSTNKNYFK